MAFDELVDENSSNEVASSNEEFIGSFARERGGESRVKFFFSF